MNKIKILAFVVFGAMLAACGSDDGSPPELKKNYEGNISPFDTLVVEFDAKLIDLDTSNVVLGNGKKWVERETNAKELRFIGTNTTAIGGDSRYGSYYFAGGKSDSIVFINIKNSDGYIKDRTVFYFSTLKILDIEPNNLQKDANDIESPGDSIINGVTFAGVIDKNMGIGDDGFPKLDNDDFYKFNLKRNDVIEITVKNTIKNKPTSLKVNFSGDCYALNTNSCNDKTDSTTAKNKFSVTLRDTIKTGHEQEGDIVGKISPFYIRISENANDKPNPYIVTVKKL